MYICIYIDIYIWEGGGNKGLYLWGYMCMYVGICVYVYIYIYIYMLMSGYFLYVHSKENEEGTRPSPR